MSQADACQSLFAMPPNRWSMGGAGGGERTKLEKKNDSSVDVCLCVFVFTRELQCAIKNREEERENKVECVSRTQVQIHLVPKTIPRLTQSTIIKDHQGFPSCYFLDVCFPALYHHRTIFKSSPFYLHSPISQIMIPQQALQSYMRPSILTASLWVRKSPPLK